MPYLHALYSKGMPRGLYDLCETLVRRPPEGISQWQPVGPLGLVFHTGSAPHCSYICVMCYMCMKMTHPLLLQDQSGLPPLFANQSTWSIVRAFLEPLETFDFSLRRWPLPSMVWPVPNEVSARGIAVATPMV